MIFSGMSPDGLLPEIVERPDHPWFIGVQFHPELKSKPFDPHPLRCNRLGSSDFRVPERDAGYFLQARRRKTEYILPNVRVPLGGGVRAEYCLLLSSGRIRGRPPPPLLQQKSVAWCVSDRLLRPGRSNSPEAASNAAGAGPTARPLSFQSGCTSDKLRPRQPCRRPLRRP